MPRLTLTPLANAEHPESQDRESTCHISGVYVEIGCEYLNGDGFRPNDQNDYSKQICNENDEKEIKHPFDRLT